MREGHIAIYYGKGKGKTSIAVGRGMRAIGEDLRVVMIQFMDYHNSKETALLKKMEPDFRVFRFEKDRDGVDVHDGELDEHLKKEIGSEIRNAFNFAKKIVGKIHLKPIACHIVGKAANRLGVRVGISKIGLYVIYGSFIHHITAAYIKQGTVR